MRPTITFASRAFIHCMYQHTIGVVDFPLLLKEDTIGRNFWIQEVRLEKELLPSRIIIIRTQQVAEFASKKKTCTTQILHRSSNSKNTKWHLAVLLKNFHFFLDPPFWNHYQPPFPAHNSRQLTKTGRVSQTPKLRSKDPKAVRPQVTQLTDSTVCRGSKRPSTQKVAVTLSVYKLLKMCAQKKIQW